MPRFTVDDRDHAANQVREAHARMLAAADGETPNELAEVSNDFFSLNERLYAIECAMMEDGNHPTPDKFKARWSLPF